MSRGNEVKSSILKKLKNSVIGEEEKIDIDGVDLDSGTIVIDDTGGPQEIVKTDQVLRAGFDHETDIFFKGFTGTVFVLDLNPFLASIGTTSISRIGESLIAFAENILTRELHGVGSFKNYSNEQFFFRLNKDDAEGWVMAAKAVNAIGEHFLRDSYDADDMMSELLASVDINDLKGANGEFDGAAAMANKQAITSVEDAIQKSEEPLWEALDHKNAGRIKDAEWGT